MARRLKICLINPKFEPSYWGFDYALPLYPGSVKCTMVTGALPHLAGLTPDHEVYIRDENVEAIDFATLTRFDIVGVTGGFAKKGLPALRNSSIAAWPIGISGNLPKKAPPESCTCLTPGEKACA